jgi:hypothetical protein
MKMESEKRFYKIQFIICDFNKYFRGIGERLYFRIYHVRGKKIETQFIHFARVPSSSPFILYPFVVGLAVRGGCTLHTHSLKVIFLILLPSPYRIFCSVFS